MTTVTNLGAGGSALNAQSGSTVGADTNDPMLLTHTGTNYAYLPGVAGNGLSVPDAANLTPTTSLSVRVAIAMPDWSPAASGYFATHGVVGGWSWGFGLANTGAPFLVTSTDGTTLSPSFVPGGGANLAAQADGSLLAIRTDWTASPAEVKFFTKAVTQANADAECLSDTGWTQLGTTATASVPSTALFNATSTLSISGFNNNATSPVAGSLHAAVVKVDGSTVLDIDPSVITTGAATSFVAQTGQTVAVNRSTSGRKTVIVTRPVWLFGTDDYMEVADNDLLDFGASDSFTVVAVVRQWGTPTSSGLYVSKRGGGTNIGWELSPFGTAATVLASVDDGPNLANRAVQSFTFGSITALGFQVDRTAQTIASSVNSTLSATTSTASVGSLTNASNMTIGRAPRTSPAYQDFELLAVAIFRRVLTTTELAAIAAYYGAV